MPDGSVLLTRYADCEYVYKNPPLFSSDKKTEYKPKYGDSLLYEHHTTSLVFNDPPLHTRVRRLIIGALTPKAIAEMQPGLEALVDRLLDRMAKAGDVDLIEDFAAAIPIEIVGNLLGVPKDEREPLRGWSLAILGALEPVVTPDAFERGNRAVHDFIAYLEDLLERRRASPGHPDRDVLTRLIQGEDAGERLSPPELAAQLHLPAQRRPRDDDQPDRQRTRRALPPSRPEGAAAGRAGAGPPAVEEVLRYESSNQLGNRITTGDVEVGGVALPARTQITLAIGAANRDPERFEDPERFDIGRTPNRHLAFGSGIHQCAGMALARLEGAIAIGRFLARFPRYALNGEPVRGGRARFRGFLEVPCRVEPGR